MKKLLFLSIFILFTSCYVYKAPEVKKGEENLGIKEMIQPDNRYEINSNGKTFKIKAIKWEQDSLIAHINGNKRKEIKLNQNQITEVKNRVFSRGRSDALTFGSYTLIGAIILFLGR